MFTTAWHAVLVLLYHATLFRVFLPLFSSLFWFFCDLYLRNPCHWQPPSVSFALVVFVSLFCCPVFFSFFIFSCLVLWQPWEDRRRPLSQGFGTCRESLEDNMSVSPSRLSVSPARLSDGGLSCSGTPTRRWELQTAAVPGRVFNIATTVPIHPNIRCTSTYCSMEILKYWILYRSHSQCWISYNINSATPKPIQSSPSPALFVSMMTLYSLSFSSSSSSSSCPSINVL